MSAIPELTRELNLELATATFHETFSKESDRTTCWGLIDLGTSIVQVQVPVTYRYHLCLRDAWQLEHQDRRLIVHAPVIRPSLPPAIHTDQLTTLAVRGWATRPGGAFPYLYNYLGSPWKTQKRVRMLLDTWFTDTTLGMPGDEDGGGMSAFVVFSMMGLYPVTPGVPIYDLCSPVFDRITIRLHNGKTIKIICRNNSKDNKYIQSILLNGKPLDQVWIRHADIVNGGTLELQMGNTPNKDLGADQPKYPPSTMEVRPDSYK